MTSDPVRGREAYEADLKRTPNYHDGKPRPQWDDLSEIAKWSWSRPEPREGLS